MVGKGAKQLLNRGRSVAAPVETAQSKHHTGSFGPSFTELSVTDIDRSPYQPRFAVNHEHVEALAASIRTGSLIEPIVVRPTRDGRYELIAGEHRLQAVKTLGIEVIPALVKRVSDGEAMTMATVDNVAREQLTDLEQGFAFARLAREYDYSQAGIAELVSKPKSHVQRCMKLTELPSEVLDVLKTVPSLIGGTTGVELLHRCEQGNTDLVLQAIAKLKGGELLRQHELADWIDGEIVKAGQPTAPPADRTARAQPVRAPSGVEYLVQIKGSKLRLTANCPSAVDPAVLQNYLNDAIEKFLTGQAPI